MKTAQVLSLLIAFIFPLKISAANDNVAGSIWNYPSRSVAEVVSWFTTINTTPAQTSPTVLGTEDLSEKPILEVAAASSGLGTKLDSTGATLDELYLDYQQVLSETVLIGLQWDNLTVAELTQSIDKQNAILSETSETVDWLSRAWGWPQLDTIKTQVNSVKTNLATVRSIASTSGMLPVAYDQLKSTAQQLESVVSLVGVKTSDSSEASLFGRFGLARDQAAQLDGYEVELEDALKNADFKNLSQTEVSIMNINQIPQVSVVLESDSKNKALGLLAIIQANRLMMAQDRGQTITTTWLEENTSERLVFKTLVANPSLLARQEIAVKYYLPSEIQETDIMHHDSTVLIGKDEERNQLFVEGRVVVAAGGARLVVVESLDKWQLDSSSIESSRSQAVQLLNSLANSPKFVHAVELKGDIDVAATKVLGIETSRLTPLERIKTTRQLMAQLSNMNNNVTQLQNLTKSDLGQARQALSGWEEMILGVSGLMFIVMGVIVFYQPTKYFRWSRQPKPTVSNFNVFSDGIATSDL